MPRPSEKTLERIIEKMLKLAQDLRAELVLKDVDEADLDEFLRKEAGSRCMDDGHDRRMTAEALVRNFRIVRR